MGSTISIAQTTLISMVIESLLFGAFTIMFASSQTVLFEIKGRAGNYNRPLWFACIVMFILALTHFAVNCVRLMKGFIDDSSQGPNASNGTDAFFSNLENPTYMVKTTIFVAQTLLGDLCIIYRTYVVWARNKWIVVVPVLLFIGSFVSGIMTLEALFTSAATVTVFQQRHWDVAELVTTMLTNVICTGFIAGRIWSVSIRRSSHGIALDDNLRPVVTIIIESGLLYSASILTTMITLLSGSWSHLIFIDAMSAIVGITFTMIIVRLRAHQKQVSSDRFPSQRTQSVWNPGRRGPLTDSGAHGLSLPWNPRVPEVHLETIGGRNQDPDAFDSLYPGVQRKARDVEGDPYEMSDARRQRVEVKVDVISESTTN